MRKFLVSLMLLVLFAPIALRADEIIVGDGTATSSAAPFRTPSKYSWIEMIYPSSEIGQALNITSLAFNCATAGESGTNYSLTASEVRVYLAEVDKSSIATAADWTPEADLTLVYTGNDVIIGDEEWETIYLDTPFNYSGTKNLAVVVSKSATTTAQSVQYYYKNVGNSVLMSFDISSPENSSFANYPTANGYLSYTRPNIKLGTELTGNEIVLGTGTESTSSVPFSNSRRYSWVESIYSKDEIGQAMTISSLAYNCATYNSGNGYTLATDEIKVYIAETDKDTHSNNGNWVAESEYTLVYTGTGITIGDEEWETFVLDTPYEYSGTKNLAIAVSKKSSSYNSASKWVYTTVDGASIYRRDDNNTTFADYPVGNGTLIANRPNVKIGFSNAVVPEIPAAPTNLTATATSESTVALAWEAVTGATEYNIYNGTESVATGVTTTSYNVTGLTAGTEYCFNVKADNIAGESAASEEACATPTVANQSEYALYTDFNDGTMNGWRTIDGDGDGLNWKVSTGTGGIAGVGGSYCVYSESWSNGGAVNPNNYLVTTSSFAITEGSVLEWDVMPNNSQYCEEHYGIVYSTDGEFFTTIWEETLTSFYEYEHRSVELNYIAGQTVYIGFRHYMCSDNDAVCIDNIALTIAGGSQELASGDTWQEAIEVTEYPFAHTPDFANLNNDYTLPGEAQDGADVVYKLTFAEETTFSAAVIGTNGKLALYTEDFNGQAGPGANNYYGAEETPDPDPDPENPTSFLFDFNEANYNGLRMIDADNDGLCWEIEPVGYQGSYVGYDNTCSILSYSWKSGYAQFTPDNYLVTEQAYTITAESVVSLNAKPASSVDYAEHYGIVISEDGENWTTIFEETLASNAWITKEVSLAQYAGQNLYIGIRHFDCTYLYYIMVDNFQLSDGAKRTNFNGINNITVPAGTYYLVASATEAFSVNINVATEPETGLIPVAQVTATENAAKVDVAWSMNNSKRIAHINPATGKIEYINNNRDESEYTFHSYKLYRANGDNEPIVLAENLTETTYQDATWAEAESSVYKWGVAAMYTANNATREEVTLINEGFEVGYYMMPEGWTTYSDPSTANQYGNFNAYSSLYSDVTAYEGAYSAFTLGGYATTGSLFYLVSPALDLTSTLNTTLDFYYTCPEFWGFANTLSVKYGTSPTGPWTNVWTGEITTQWTNVNVNLSECSGQTIYIAFCSEENGGWGVGVDKVIVKGTASDGPIPVASEIVWSNTIDKDMTTTVAVNVETNDGGSVVGTTVTLANVNEPTYVYETTLDATGTYTWTDVRKGTYEVTIELEGYNSCADGEIMEIMDATTINCTIELKPELIEGLYVSATGWAMWTAEDTTFDVVLEGETVADDITTQYYQLDVTSLVEGEDYTTNVIIDNSTTAAMEYTWTYMTCDNYAGVVNLAATIDEGTATLTWTLPVYEDLEPAYEFESNFDNGSLNGWTNIDADGDGHVWRNTSEHANQGFGVGNTYCASSLSYDNEDGAIYPDNYLVTNRKYTITEGSKLTFSVCAQSNTHDEEHYGVAISTTNNTDATAFTTIFEETLDAGNVEYGSIQGQWFTKEIDLSAYAGQEIYIAFRHFNCTNMFWINLDNVELSNPTRDEEGEWLFYDNETYESAFGVMDYNTMEPSTMYWAIMFPADVISQYAGTVITKLSMYIFEAHDGAFSIHTGGDTAPGTMVHVQEYSATTTGEFVEFELTSPVTISGTENIWIQFSNTTGYMVAAHSADCGEANGRWMSYDGTSWFDTEWFGTGWYGTWMIHAYVEGDATPLPDEPEEAQAEVLGVMLYRNGELLTEQPLYAETYTDNELTAGDNEYAVRVVYGGESSSTYYAMSCADEITVTSEIEVIAPTDLTGEDTYNEDGTYGVTLNWIYPYTPCDHFNIYRKTANHNYELVGETESLTYFDEINEDGTYFYQVKAVIVVEGQEFESEAATTTDGNDFVEIELVSIDENGLIDMTIYPNPTKDNINIAADNMTRITVTNALGQVVYDTEVVSNNETINMAQYEAGVYIVRITTDNGVAVERITVIK